MKKYDLYMGDHIKATDDRVSRNEFRRFLRRHVDPVFEGYTVTEGHGFWHGKPENTYILTIIGPADIAPEVAAIGSEYSTAYLQDGVYMTEQSLESAAVVTPIPVAA